ncbi:MAG: hypothetical protein ACRYE9_03355 [Janthinobacterium lividum]
MKTSSILVGIATATLLTLGSVYAEDMDTNKMNSADMEKCKVVKDGKESWVMVPKGECDKVNKGDYSNVSDEVKEKLGVTTPSN